MGRQDVNIDKAKEQKAWTAAALRAVVAGYIAYMGYRIVTNEDTTMSPATAKLFGVLFALLAAGFAVYIVYRWRIDMADARISPDSPDAQAEDTGSSASDEAPADHDGV